MEVSALESAYRKKFAFYKEPLICEAPSGYLRLCVVIPSYNENLGPTLQSLSECEVTDAREVEVIIVLNHSTNAPEDIRNYHHKQAIELPRKLSNGLVVHPVAAFDLPAKHAGVGLARKIGMDEATFRFGQLEYDGLIVCLDGDCTVSVNYLQSLLTAEEQHYKGLSIYYEHPLNGLDDQHVKAIVNYEIFLRFYAQGLQWAGYPFPFQTVGSSMAARATAYMRVGGMNKRKAGEDFYFLHKLFPQGLFTAWPHCTVYPSARISKRVPFGTGKAMIASKAGEKDYGRLYHPQLFRDLRLWLLDLKEVYTLNSQSWPETVRHFLEQQDWRADLQDLTLRSKTYEQFKRNFYFWLDGFKILRFLHSNPLRMKDVDNCTACSELLGTKATNPYDLLMELRKREKEAPLGYL